jgi:hypothetical protein
MGREEGEEGEEGEGKEEDGAVLLMLPRSFISITHVLLNGFFHMKALRRLLSSERWSMMSKSAEK